MIWDVNQPEPWKPGKVFDANGEEIEGVVWMDTDTGEVERLQFQLNGFVALNDEDYPLSGPMIVRGFHPAPLTVVEIEEPAA